MKLIVPTNWQDDILQELPLQEINGFYGQLDRDFTGGGKPSCILPAVGRAKAAAHIASISAKGLSFNYLLNSACMGNAELTPAGRKRLRALLDWICNYGADCVTCFCGRTRRRREEMFLTWATQSLSASLKGFTKLAATARPAVNAGSAPKRRARR
jgi:hypothetical protein